MTRLFICTAMIALALAALDCRSAETAPASGEQLPGAGLFVVNEGGFSGGGSLSFYSRTNDTLYNGVAGSGWIFPNDMKIAAGKGYVAVNGLDRVDAVDLSSGALLRSITFPRFTGPEFLTLRGAMLYVANANGSVSGVSMAADTIVWTTPGVVGFPGGIAAAAGKVFVSDAGYYPVTGTKVAVVDSATGTVLDSVRVGGGPGAIAALGADVYVLCSAAGTVVRIDAAAPAAAESLSLHGYFSDMTTDGTSLYAMTSDSVYRVTVGPLAAAPLIGRTGGIYFYAIGADGAHGEIYLADITAGGGSGELEIYTTAGVRKRPPLAAGIFPGAFAVKP